MKIGFSNSAVLSILFLFASGAGANPYLAKPGETPVSIRIATCAVSGGFVHLYTALDHGLFDKYGIKANHIYVRGSGISLTALASDEIQFLFCARSDERRVGKECRSR